LAKAKKPFYFSVDFEDFGHDFRRSLGEVNAPCNEAALWKSYERVKYLTDKFFDNRKVTFFVTGVLSRAAPDLVRQISQDGHEVACHYNFHDKISEGPREELGPNLDDAISSIEAATGVAPVGFRAPYFAIDSDDSWAFEELSKRFLYDSSYRTSERRDDLAPGGTMRFGKNSLREFFIYGHPHMGGRFAVRTGGTFLRLFPAQTTIDAMESGCRKGHDALLYMHTYELLTGSEFWVAWKDISKLPAKNRRLQWARQVQWIKMGHKGVERKLAAICEHFEHRGPMRMALADARAA
jgi:hypothetical protein